VLPHLKPENEATQEQNMQHPISMIYNLFGVILLSACFFGSKRLAGTEQPAESVINEKKATPILNCDFDQIDLGGLKNALVKNRYCDLVPGAGLAGSNALRVRYVGYDRGSKRVVVDHQLSERLNNATLSFYVRFADGFQWTHGGKLHGVGPDKPITGGKTMQPNGWSSRMMWKADGVGNSYLYAQNKPGAWGWTTSSNKPVFQAGKWHAVSIVTLLNTLGEADGEQFIFIDGQQVIHHREVAFRGVGGKQTRISKVLFRSSLITSFTLRSLVFYRQASFGLSRNSAAIPCLCPALPGKKISALSSKIGYETASSTFHGGNKPRWAPRAEDGSFTTVIADFDQFMVHPGTFILPPVVPSNKQALP
jgi:hypothetical protein